MNTKELAQNVGLEEEEFIELAEIFLEACVSDLDRLEHALAIEDAQGVSVAAHSIKGAAVNLGIDEVFELAKGIELRACRNCFDESRKAVSALKEELCLLAERLKPNIPTNSEQMARDVSNS
jgi:HPt (histidine-containing phosphotransfer) domain-containing protein